MTQISRCLSYREDLANAHFTVSQILTIMSFHGLNLQQKICFPGSLLSLKIALIVGTCPPPSDSRLDSTNQSDSDNDLLQRGIMGTVGTTLSPSEK